MWLAKEASNQKLISQFLDNSIIYLFIYFRSSANRCMLITMYVSKSQVVCQILNSREADTVVDQSINSMYYFTRLSWFEYHYYHRIKNVPVEDDKKTKMGPPRNQYDLSSASLSLVLLVKSGRWRYPHIPPHHMGEYLPSPPFNLSCKLDLWFCLFQLGKHFQKIILGLCYY